MYRRGPVCIFKDKNRGRENQNNKFPTKQEVQRVAILINNKTFNETLLFNHLNHLGDWFAITAGVRQGGVLSPNLYAIYVDNMIYILRSSGIGCYVSDTFAAALF